MTRAFPLAAAGDSLVAQTRKQPKNGGIMEAMSSRNTGPIPGKEFDKRVRQQLDRILNSATFRDAGRLKRFIDFIVLEALGGHTDQLKEYAVGVEVFDKKSSFDPRTDPIVRVQARRLRVMLERYYRDEGHRDEIVIDLPKGGYAPVFAPRESVAPAAKGAVTVTLMQRNTVAVTAFADYSPGTDLDYFCKGLRQEVIGSLSKLRDIRLLAWVPSSATEQARAGGSIAATMVSGSVRKSGNELRVDVQLIDGATGCYLWSETIDGDLQDTFPLQKEVAYTVVKKFQAELFSAEHARGWMRPSENLAARNLYLQGRYHLNQRTEEELRKAADFFERALREDPQYALAHSGLADAYGLLGHYGVLAPADVWTKAASSAATAVILDDNSVEAHTSLAHVKSTQDWDWGAAQRQFEQAFRLDFSYATAHHWYAMSCLVPLGRLDEALNEMVIAQSLDPVSAIIARDVAVVHCYRCEYEAALEQCDHTIELNPHFSPAFWTLGLIQEQRRDYEEAGAAFLRAIHLSPDSPRMRAALGHLSALSGKKSRTLEVLQELKELAARRYVSPFEFASLHFALGETDTGFEWLTKAVQDRCFELLAINVHPRFDRLRKDNRFSSIVKQMRLLPSPLLGSTAGMV